MTGSGSTAKSIQPLRAIGEGLTVVTTALMAMVTLCLPKLTRAQDRAVEAALDVDEPGLLEKIVPYPIDD